MQIALVLQVLPADALIVLSKNMVCACICACM